MTDPTEAEIEAAAKVIDPHAWHESENGRRIMGWEQRQGMAINTARAALIAAAQVRERAAGALLDILGGHKAEMQKLDDNMRKVAALMPIYGATEDSIRDYASDRAFTGTSELSPKRLKQLRENYRRTHTEHTEDQGEDVLGYRPPDGE